MSVIVTVPGTTANLGPGFDSLGIALSLYNQVRLKKGGERSEHPMIDAAADAFFTRSRRKSFAFQCSIDGDVPRARGLGSSVTVRLGVLHGLNALTGEPLDAVALYRLCAQLEGHPDNAAPAAFGGFTAARANADYVRVRLAASLRFVLWIPDFEVATADARRVLPAQFSRTDAVANIGNAAVLTAALMKADYAAAKGCFTDFIHQPYRASLIPHFEEILQAADKAGALGAWLSGSGSTIAAMTLDHADRIARAMQKAGGTAAKVLIVKADNRGVQVRTIDAKM